MHHPTIPVLVTAEDFVKTNKALFPSTQRLYCAVREGRLPAGVVVRNGRRLAINLVAWEAFVAAGGTAAASEGER